MNIEPNHSPFEFHGVKKNSSIRYQLPDDHEGNKNSIPMFPAIGSQSVNDFSDPRRVEDSKMSKQRNITNQKNDSARN